MNIIEALNIFQLCNIHSIDDVSLRNKYKCLMRKNHPDIGGSNAKAQEINVAYDILGHALKQIKALDAMSNTTEPLCFIPFNKLSDIYNGDEIQFEYDNKSYTLNRKSLKNINVILSIDVLVTFRGMVIPFNILSKLNLKDEYSITCRLDDSDMYSTEQIIINVAGKIAKFDMVVPRTDIKFKFDNEILLTVHLERVQKDG